MSRENVTMYRPRLSLKRGYEVVHGKIDDEGWFRSDDRPTIGCTVNGAEFFDTKEAALRVAEDQRRKRIASLKRTLIRLDAVGPHWPPEEEHA